MSMSNPHLSEVKSQCPVCGKLYGYEPNGTFICEVGETAVPPHAGDIPLGEVGCHKDTLAKTITFVSFSYKYAIPLGIAWLADVRRTVRNPWRDPNLRKLTGLDSKVQAFVGRCRGAQSTLARIRAKCQMTGERPITIAIGCMGGRHRSVALVELAATGLKRDYPHWKITVHHRDINRRGKDADDE